MISNRKITLFSLVALGAALSTSSQALSFSGSQLVGGYTYSASSDFTYDNINNLLLITLNNTAVDPVTNQAQTLSGIYFDVTGNPVLTTNSANVGTGSTIVNDSPNLNDSKIGQEWAFRNNMVAADATFTDARYGISSTGLGIFAPTDRFDTSGNLAGPGSGSVAGDDFSIVPASQASYTSGGLTGTPFTQSSMIYRLNTPVNFILNANTIQNVVFHYSSAQEGQSTTGHTPDVPEPGTLAMLIGIAPIGAAYLIRRRKIGKIS